MIVPNIYAHARQRPNKIAVIYGEYQLSYREFADAIGAVQRYFGTLGLSAGGVAVLAIAALADSWIVGLALRGLGLTTVAVRSADQLSQLGLSNIQCVVTSEIEGWLGLESLCATAGWQRVLIPEAIFADIAAGTVQLAKKQGGHILLTSGTTGHYKKVLIDSGRSAIQASLRKRLLEISGRSVLNMTQYPSWTGAGYHYPSITWASGGTVVFQEVNLFAPLHRGRVTHAKATPWTLAQAFAAPRGVLCRDDAMRLYLGGGPLSQSLADETRARLTRQIYTYLAATEVGPFALTPLEGPEDLRWHRILPSREAQIVDADDRILPAGREGRLRVRVIDGLNGYLHDDETSRAFFHNGYFYSGDLGVIGPDGRLALVGRVTDVVNILGSKFPPGPIEEAVQREFGVSAACVFSMNRADGEEIVHIAIESRQRVDLDRLAVLLGKMLPSPFQTPVHHVETLPRNHMGKVQRDILRHQLGLAGKPRDISHC